jgi:hypothetical protein
MDKVAKIKKQDFENGFIGRKDLAISDVLSHLGVQRFDSVGGVEHTPEVDRVTKESREMVPGFLERVERQGSGRRSRQDTNFVRFRM